MAMFSLMRNFCKLPSPPLGLLISQQPAQPIVKVSMRSLSSILSSSCIEPAVSNPTASLTSSKFLKSDSSSMYQCVRTKVRVYYKGSAWKRYNKHNIEKRLTTPGGLEMLWRKTLKGRLNLAPYERILPNTVNSKILPAHHFKYKAHPLTKRRLPKPGLF